MENNKFEAFEYYKGLPPWGKGVVGTIIIGGLAAAVYFTIQSIKAKQKALASAAEISGFNNDLTSLTKQGVAPTYQQSQYEQWADGIASEFTGCDPSIAAAGILFSATDGSTYSSSGSYMLTITQALKNNADFLALQVAFGTRTISKHWWCGGDDVNMTLSACMADQLTQTEIGGLNSVLASAGITYTF